MLFEFLPRQHLARHPGLRGATLLIECAVIVPRRSARSAPLGERRNGFAHGLLSPFLDSPTVCSTVVNGIHHSRLNATICSTVVNGIHHLRLNARSSSR